jgi:hypothetical protein
VERGKEKRTGGGVDDRVACWGVTPATSPAPSGGGGCSEPGWCQGAPLRYERGGPHTMVVSSELVLMSQCSYTMSNHNESVTKCLCY